MIKGRGQRLIPEELLKYLEAYKEAHPDPTQGGGATLDDIVDAQGNKRFVEGDIEKVGTYNINYLYNKWSLSGTHLMLVMCISNTSGDDIYITNDTKIFSLTLPEYIYNKIYAISSDLVMQKKFSDFTDNRTFTMQLKKDGNNELGLYVVKNSQVGNTYTYRFQFDLLIDSDYSE